MIFISLPSPLLVLTSALTAVWPVRLRAFYWCWPPSPYLWHLSSVLQNKWVTVADRQRPASEMILQLFHVLAGSVWKLHQLQPLEAEAGQSSVLHHLPGPAADVCHPSPLLEVDASLWPLLMDNSSIFIWHCKLNLGTKWNRHSAKASASGENWNLNVPQRKQIWVEVRNFRSYSHLKFSVIKVGNQRRFKLYFTQFNFDYIANKRSRRQKFPLSLAMDGCNNSKFNHFFRQNRVLRKLNSIWRIMHSVGS